MWKSLQIKKVQVNDMANLERYILIFSTVKIKSAQLS